MKRAVTMRAALGDPHLLGAALAGDSWATWRVFLIAMMGEKLTDKERKVFCQFTGRDREPGIRVEEALFLIGRRGGKDRAASVLAAYLAALVDWTSVLVKGERGIVLCIGADTKQATVQRDYIEGVFDSSPMLSSLVVNKTADGIELSNNITVAVRAANFRRLRGVTCCGVIASESAYWLDETSANADIEILNAVRPTLATTGGPLILITTPYARRGATWELYRRHYGVNGDPLVLVVQGTSREFNETLPQRVVDRALERDPAAASAEYLAQFRNDLSSYVDPALIEGAVDRGVAARPPQAGKRYVSWIDASSGASDSFACAIGHAEGRDLLMLDCLVEVRSPFNTAAATQQVANVLKSYNLFETMGDDYAKGWVISELARHGVRFTPRPSEMNRSALYLETLSLFSSARVRLLDSKRLVSQYAQLERRVMPAGRDVVDHPNRSGHHDDLSNVTSGVLWRLAAGVAPLRFTPEMVAEVLAHPPHRPNVHSVWPLNKANRASARVFIPLERRCMPRSVLPREKFLPPDGRSPPDEAND
jgi:hypothetical protein